MTTTEPTPALVLAGAEAERHDLLAAAAQTHLSNVRAETRRYEEDLRRIESVFQLRIQAVSEVPPWINDARKSDIQGALNIARVSSDDDLRGWLGEPDLPTWSRNALMTWLSTGLTDPDQTYRAWLTAGKILRAALKTARSS